MPLLTPFPPSRAKYTQVPSPSSADVDADMIVDVDERDKEENDNDNHVLHELPERMKRTTILATCVGLILVPLALAVLLTTSSPGSTPHPTHSGSPRAPTPLTDSTHASQSLSVHGTQPTPPPTATDDDLRPILYIKLPKTASMSLFLTLAHWTRALGGIVGASHMHFFGSQTCTADGLQPWRALRRKEHFGEFVPLRRLPRTTRHSPRRNTKQYAHRVRHHERQDRQTHTHTHRVSWPAALTGTPSLTNETNTLQPIKQHVRRAHVFPSRDARQGISLALSNTDPTPAYSCPRSVGPTRVHVSVYQGSVRDSRDSLSLSDHVQRDAGPIRQAGVH